MHSLVAATSDIVRVWDLAIASSNQQSSSNYATLRRGAASTGYSVSHNTSYTAGNMRDSVNEIKAVSWSTDGSTFVVGGKGPYMRQFSASGEPIMDIPGNEDDISDIVAIQHYGSNSESMFIADNTSRQVRRWDFASTSFAQTCQTHDNDIACMSVSAKKRLVASATRKGGEIALYNLVYNTRTELRSATHRAMLSMDFSASARTQLMVGSEDGLLQLFDATRYGEAPAKTFAHVHSAPVCALKFHPANLNYVVSAGLDGKMVLTDTVVQRSNAISVMAEAPLTCLACHQSLVVVGVGTIDGDVLVYDLRGSRTPLWKHRVATRKPLVSIDFAFEQSAMPVATGRRPSGVTMRSSVRKSGGSSDDSGIGSDHRRTRPTAAPPSSRVVGREPRATGTRSTEPTQRDSVRPPHNPAIKAHHRQVLNQLLESAHKKEPRSSNALGITSRQETEEFGSPENTVQHQDDDLESVSMIAKDRSFMEMLSPPKPMARESVRADHRKELPVAHGHMKYAEDVDLPVQHDELEQMHATGPDTDQHHLEDFDDEFDFSPVEPLRYAEPAEDEAAEERHDMGDSMMEMFTPEREKQHIVHNRRGEMDESPRPDKTPSKMVSKLIAQLKSSQKKKTTIDLAEPQESRKPAPSLKTPGRANEFSAISPRSARSIEKRRQAQMLEYERDFEPMPKRRAVQGFERTPRVANEPKSAKRSAVRFLSRAPPKYSKESVEEDLVPRTGTKGTSKYTPKPWMRHVGLPSRRQEVEKEPPVLAAVAKRHETKVARPLVRQVDRSLDEEIREKQRPSYRADPEPAAEDEEEEGEEDKQEYAEHAPRTPAAARRTERSTEAEYMRSARYQPRAVQKEEDEDHLEEGDGFAKPAAKTPAKARRSEVPAERLSGQEFGHGSQYRPRSAQHEEDEDFDEYVDERRYKPKPTLKASLSPSKVPRRLSDFDSEPVPAPETAPPPAPPPPPPVRSAEQRPPVQKRAAPRSAATDADISAKSPPSPAMQPRSQQLQKEAIPLAKVLVSAKQRPTLPTTVSDASSSKQTATSGAPKSQGASGTGSPSVGSSVLQNALVDALVPMREQIRGEIRNLHLDMIKQHFVVQELLRGLQREAAESQALRQQIEMLRKENERLMRYIPFHNMLDESDLAERPGGPNGISRVSASAQQQYQQQHQQQHQQQQRWR